MANNRKISKKVRIIGEQSYINSDTGELVTMCVTTVEERDFNFSKVWMRSFLATLDLIGNAKTKVAYWIIDNIDRENQLTYTYRQIADAVGTSLDTVTKTMSALIDSNFLRRKNQGCYIINPDILFKGTRGSRLNMLTQYQAIGYKKAEITKEERLQNLVTVIQKLTKEAEILAKQINETAQIEQTNG